MREDSCVILSVEYAGDKAEFSFNERDQESLILQGFAYVSGTDNACYLSPPYRPRQLSCPDVGRQAAHCSCGA